MYYLGTGLAGVVIRWWITTSVSDLHPAARRDCNSSRGEPWPEGISTGAAYCICSSGHRSKQGASWAINQSLIAIGSGGFSGKGFKAPNTQIELGFLPATAVHNDYIFSAIGEQWGFVGGLLLIGAFGLLLLTCLFVAFFAGDQFGLLLVIGITALIFTHVFQNIGMTISMLPITGVPLPLISYSGSFVLMIMFGLGIVNSVWVHRNVLER